MDIYTLCLKINVRNPQSTNFTRPETMNKTKQSQTIITCCMRRVAALSDSIFFMGQEVPFLLSALFFIVFPYNYRRALAVLGYIYPDYVYKSERLT